MYAEILNEKYFFIGKSFIVIVWTGTFALM
ncbi:membrane protein YpdK, partial [Salmonella enterica subsp. enterica serovar Infantis]